MSSILANKPFYLSDMYWGNMSAKNREMFLIVRPLPGSKYEVDVHLSSLESHLVFLSEVPGGLHLTPDFQRGHVWTPEQKIFYIESLMRGMAPTRILFNAPRWTSGEPIEDGADLREGVECIDGLQRITAVREFMAGAFKVFGQYAVSDLEGTHFDPRRLRLQVVIYSFVRRYELLQFYLDINTRGTPHSQSEIERVTALMIEARESYLRNGAGASSED